MIKNKKQKEYKNTIVWFDEIMNECFNVLKFRNKEYGQSICKYRPSSFTDRILTKLSRVRSVQEKKSLKVDEPIEETLSDTINYVLFRIWRLKEDDISVKKINLNKIKNIIHELKIILKKKNHDYGESWKDMRISSIIDEILVKISRIIEMENSINKNIKLKEKLNPKILDSLYDITNYLIFALIHIKEGKNPME